MCLLSVYKPGVQPILQELLNGIESNNDGVGFVIATKSGQLIVEHAVGDRQYSTAQWTDKDGVTKSYQKSVIDPTPMENLARRFIKLRKRHPEGPAMFHSRFATGGVEDTRGCHPYRVTGMSNTVLAHNGVMFSPPKDDWRSDTRIFAEDILPQRFRKFWRPVVKERMEQYLGGGNKVAIITTNPRFMTRKRGALSKAPFELFMFNEELGIWTPEGAWHSNSAYQPRYYTYRPYKANTTTAKGIWTADDEWSGGTGWANPYEYRSSQAAQPVLSARECKFCRAVNAVDLATSICEMCLCCNDCEMLANECECYYPASARMPDNVPYYSASQVEPKAITAGSQPAIVATASPDEQYAAFLRDIWEEFEDHDDPYVQAMKFDDYLYLREYEIKHNTEVRFSSADEMEEWFAEQSAIASIKARDNAWLESVAEAKDAADKAAELTAEAESILAESGDATVTVDDVRYALWQTRANGHLAIEVTPDPDDADGEPGIIHRLA